MGLFRFAWLIGPTAGLRPKPAGYGCALLGALVCTVAPSPASAESPSRPQRGSRAAERAAAPIRGASGSPVVEAKQGRDGVRTYTFGAQQVEGRVRTPQILYFLRRVRAEFDPKPLGHRSFLLELSDTRRHRSLR